MHIIIDGYNLIRQSDSLRRLDKLSLEGGRGELIRRVAEYRRRRGHKITIVFDGWMGGSAKEERLRERGVTVVYSRMGETADEVIKRIAWAERGTEFVIVSSDREVGEAAVRAGGVAVSSPEFEERMEMPSDGETLEEDDDLTPRAGTKKKGAAWKSSRRERRARRRLNKL